MNDATAPQVMALGTIAHPNIVKLIGVSVHGPHRSLCYELCTGGNLLDRLILSEPNELDGLQVLFVWWERIRLLIEVCLGLACLHEVGLLHCDIKPANVLIRGDGSAALADFGLSRSQAFLAMGGYKGGFTPGYEDPHWKVDRTFTPASDVYALGVVIMQILTKKSAKEIKKVVDHHLPTPMPSRQEWDALKSHIISEMLQDAAQWHCF